MTTSIECIERLALHLAHHMGRIIISSIGDGGSKIGYLQRSEVDLTLSDRDTDNGESVP